MPLFDNPIVVTALMFTWGICVRYMPALKDWPNRLIVVGTAVIGVLAKLVAPEVAHAGAFGHFAHSLGWALIPLQQIVARQVFETFVKPLLEHAGIVGYPAPPLKAADVVQGAIPR